jgi:hypothetical protein
MRTRLRTLKVMRAKRITTESRQLARKGGVPEPTKK